MKRVFVLAVLLVSAPLWARDTTDPYEQFRAETDRSEFEFDESFVTPWKEQLTKIPVVNLDKLQPLEIDHGPIGADIYVDESTVRMSYDDRLVRYWMVLKSKSGRYGSMSYEAIRCGTNEYKIYGHASAKRPSLIRHVKNPQWRVIKEISRDPHFEMARDYFCAGAVPRKDDAILHALRGYGNLNPAAGLTDLNTLLDN